MVMSDHLRTLFIDRYFRGLIPEEHGEYLRRHYGDEGMDWGIQPPMLSVWFKEDPDQFWNEEFDNDENVERRKLRMQCLDIAIHADEIYQENAFAESEVLAIYDTLFWIYLSRTRPSERINPVRASDSPLPFE